MNESNFRWFGDITWFTVITFLLSTSAISGVLAEEETGSLLEMKQSKHDYKHGDIRIITHFDENQTRGLTDLSVYRAKRLILNKSLSPTQGVEHLWLGFAFPSTNQTKRIHTFDGGIKDFIADSAKPGVNPFTDLNGDGVPDLLVATNTGGMHCCVVYAVYSLERSTRRLAIIDGGHSDIVRFADVDHNGKYEALLNDWTFAYWKTSFAQSPAPLIILAPGKTGYKLAGNLMKTSPPSKRQQEQILHNWSISCQISDHGQTFTLDSSVWRDMLDLIYSGNSKVAFSLLDKFWITEKFATNLESKENSCDIINTSKGAFSKLFLKQLSLSPYLAGIKQLNRSDTHIRNLHN